MFDVLASSVGDVCGTIMGRFDVGARPDNGRRCRVDGVRSLRRGFFTVTWLVEEVAAEVQLFRCLRHGNRWWRPLSEERRGGSVQGGAEQKDKQSRDGERRWCCCKGEKCHFSSKSRPCRDKAARCSAHGGGESVGRIVIVGAAIRTWRRRSTRRRWPVGNGHARCIVLDHGRVILGPVPIQGRPELWYRVGPAHSKLFSLIFQSFSNMPTDPKL
jgi:hypothetical protein